MPVEPASPAAGSGPAAVPQQALTSSANLQKKFPTPASFATWLNSKNPAPIAAGGTNIPQAKTLGAQWTAWYAQEKPGNPQFSLGEFEYTFLTAAEFGGLAQAIVDEAEGLGSFTGTAASATVSTLDQLGSWESALTGLLGGLTSANLWIRVAKVAIGGTLLIVGLAKLTGADKSVAVLGKAVAKAPLL